MEDSRRDELLQRTLELFLRLAVTAQAGKPVPWSLWAIMTAAYNAAQEDMPRAEEFLRLAEDVFHKDLPGGMRDGILKMPLPLELVRREVPEELPAALDAEDDLDQTAEWFTGLFEHVSSMVERRKETPPPSEGTEALFLLLLAVNNAVHRGLSVSVPILRTFKQAWDAMDAEEQKSLLGPGERSPRSNAMRRR